VSGQQHAPAALYPRERPGTHCTGGWVGPRAIKYYYDDEIEEDEMEVWHICEK